MEKKKIKQSNQKLHEVKKPYTPQAAGNDGMRKANNKLGFHLAEMKKNNKKT